MQHIWNLFEPTENGLPEVPAEYAELQGRKVMVDSWNLFELIKNPNKIAMVLYCIIFILIVVIVLIIRRVKRRR